MIGMVKEVGGICLLNFGYLALTKAGREEEGKRKREEEMQQNIKIEMLRRRTGGRRTKFGVVDKNICCPLS